MKQSYLISRRTMLRGAGAALALPWLDIMTPAVAAASTRKRPPIRMGVLYKGNGVHPPSWDISGTSETKFELSPLMQPLKSVRKDVLLLSNLDHAAGGWSHQSSAVAFLSSLSAKGRSLGGQQPISIDQFVADRVGQHTPMRSLEMTSDGIFLPAPITSYVSFAADGRELPRESDPQIIFDRMFRGIGTGNNRGRNRSVLDAVLSEAKDLRRKASAEDQTRLDRYFDSVRAVEQQLEQAGKPAPGRWQPTTPPKLDRPGVAEGFPARVKALLDMMVLAFWTDTTRVSTFMLANSSSRIVFDFLGIQEEHHYLSHFVRNAGTKYITHFNQITQWHLAQYAYLIGRLGEIPEADGRLLDNTVLMFGSGMKHGDYHSGRDLPIVMAGGQNAGIKTGRWLKYPDPQPYGNLLVSMAKAMGVEAKEFGSSTGALPGLDRTMNYDFGIKDDGSWVVREINGKLEVKGLLRPTTDLEKTNVYFVRLSNGADVKIDAPFKDLNRIRIDNYVGRVAKFTGAFLSTGGEKVMTNVDAIKPVTR